MRLLIVFLSLIALSCDDFGDSETKRLARIEFLSYNGDVWSTKYGYDQLDRINAITQYFNDKELVIATISYRANEAVILSQVMNDPLYNQTKEVHLMLDANGNTQKRIQYSRITPASNPDFIGGNFVYDTMIFEYDLEGFLKKTTGSRYDSNWVSPSYHVVKKISSTATYITENGNLIASHEQVDYPISIRDGSTTSLAGGSSEYHIEFGYTKAYPNKTDFKNAAVLNEYKEYWDTHLNNNYMNMPDHVLRRSIDRDLSGIVLWDLSGEIDMERTYSAGVLSTVTMPSGATQFVQINYFYR